MQSTSRAVPSFQTLARLLGRGDGGASHGSRSAARGSAVIAWRAVAFTSMLLGLALAGTAPPVRAQGVPRLEPGTRVRVDRTGGERVTGIVGAPQQSDALTLTVANDRLQLVPLRDIRAIAVAERRSTGAGLVRGATVGFLFGGIAGAIAGGIEAQTDSEAYFGPSPAMGVLAGVAVLGTAGAALGAIIGAAAPGNRWEVVAVPVSVGIHRAPSGAAALVLSVKH